MLECIVAISVTDINVYFLFFLISQLSSLILLISLRRSLSPSIFQRGLSEELDEEGTSAFKGFAHYSERDGESEKDGDGEAEIHT